jgi:hypothetical protein
VRAPVRFTAWNWSLLRGMRGLWSLVPLLGLSLLGGAWLLREQPKGLINRPPVAAAAQPEHAAHSHRSWTTSLAARVMNHAATAARKVLPRLKNVVHEADRDSLRVGNGLQAAVVAVQADRIGDRASKRRDYA